MEVFRLIQKLENDNFTKLSRLLILIHELSGDNQTKGIDSVSKLSKLDFLMTSPLLLRRVIYKPNAASRIVLSEHELDSIESKLTHYRYNPWDIIYRNMLNVLIAYGLIAMDINNAHYSIKITEKGILVVQELYKIKGFEEYKVRGKLIYTYLGSYSDNYLRNFFQEKFPELSTLNLNNDEYKI